MKLPVLPKSRPSVRKESARRATPLPPIPLPGDLKQRLAALRQRYRRVCASTAIFMLMCALSLLFLVQGMADWWFDLSWAARAVFFLIDLVLLGSIYRRHLHLPLKRKLDLAETALLVERKWPNLRQRVITAVELAEGKPNATRGSLQLVDRVLRDAWVRTAGLDFNQVVSTDGLRRWMLRGSIATLCALAVAGFAWPASFTLLERILLLNVPLPTKTLVVAVTHDLTVPIGGDVEMIAQAEGFIPTHGRLTVTYDDGSPEEFPLNAATDKPGFFSLTIHNVQRPFKYRFYLNDGHGAEFSVTTEVPPAVVKLECIENYPAYTGLPPEKLPPTGLSLLAGSHLAIKAVSTKALKSAVVILQGAAQQIAMTVDGTKTQVEADIPIPLKNLNGFSIHLIDEEGFGSVNDTVYPVDVVPDQPPVVKIVEPADETQTVTLRAKPVIAFEASDDYGLKQLSLDYQLVPPMVAGAETAPPLETQQIPVKIKTTQEGTRYEVTLDIAAQIPAWHEGWGVNYWIEAVDNNTATGPGITKTGMKHFGILSLAAKEAEIRTRASQSAADIDHLSTTQQKISNDVGDAIPK